MILDSFAVVAVESVTVVLNSDEEPSTIPDIDTCLIDYVASANIVRSSRCTGTSLAD